MVDENEWRGRTGDAWAAQWRRTDRSFAMLTEELLKRTRGISFAKVLDIGCGAGELSLALARGRPECSVIGVDISPQLIEEAKGRGDHLDNVQFVCADVAEWQAPPDFAPDLFVSRHGVMFFEEPELAFGHLSRMAVPRSRMLFSCFRAPEENPFFTEVVRLLPEPPELGPPGPGPFAFADHKKVRAILSAGGWEDATFAPLEIAMIIGAGEDPIEDAVAYFSSIGPAARAVRERDVMAQERFFERLRRMAQNNCQEGVVSLPASVWIVTASTA